MRRLTGLALSGAALCLSACVATTPVGETAEVSQELADLARPGQDLSNVRLLSDGCYWWLYRGVVEDTLIPLETRDGRGICVRAQRPGAGEDET